MSNLKSNRSRLADREEYNEREKSQARQDEFRMNKNQFTSNSDEFTRLSPWDIPDPKRQKLLNDRLSNPYYRSSRSAHSRRDTYRPSEDRLNASLNSSDLRTRGSRPWTASSSQRLSTQTTVLKIELGGNKSGSPRHDLYGSRRRQPPLFRVPAGRTVTSSELDEIVERMSRPTVASEGGVELRDKEFIYTKPQPQKTFPVIPGLDRRYLGLRHVSEQQLQEIIQRLTRMTSAYTAKFSPNRNVYVDTSPGAHMVQKNRFQPV